MNTPTITDTLDTPTFFNIHSDHPHLVVQTFWVHTPTTINTLTTPICSYTYSEYTRLLQQTLWPHPPALTKKKKHLLTHTHTLIAPHLKYFDLRSLPSAPAEGLTSPTSLHTCFKHSHLVSGSLWTLSHYCTCSNHSLDTTCSCKHICRYSDHTLPLSADSCRYYAFSAMLTVAVNFTLL